MKPAWNKGKKLGFTPKCAFKKGHIPKNYKGENASYSAKHKWIKYHFGKATRCENEECKFKNPRRFEWANISGKWKLLRSDYKQLCPSCHRKFDFGNYCKKGHPLFGKNLRIKRLVRICRICQNEYRRKRYAYNKLRTR